MKLKTLGIAAMGAALSAAGTAEGDTYHLYGYNYGPEGAAWFLNSDSLRVDENGYRSDWEVMVLYHDGGGRKLPPNAAFVMFRTIYDCAKQRFRTGHTVVYDINGNKISRDSSSAFDSDWDEIIPATYTAQSSKLACDATALQNDKGYDFDALPKLIITMRIVAASQGWDKPTQ